jgi:membrane-associated protein
MIPGMDIVDFISLVGLIGVALVVYAESGLLIGFFLPGDSLLLTTGLLTHRGVISQDIHLVVLILFLAAVLGDNTGYWFGKKAGRRLFKRKDSAIFHKNNLEKAEAFYEKHGSKTIVLARFVPFARTFAPIIAGVSHMKYSTFIIFNIIGALLWAVGLTYLGYYAGAWLEHRGVDIDKYLLLIIAFIVLLSILPPMIHGLKDKERRQNIKETIKKTASRKNKK